MYLLDDCKSTPERPTSRLYEGPCESLIARTTGEISETLLAIEASTRKGRHVVVVVSYELGEWLQGLPARAGQQTPFITALAFERVTLLSRDAVDIILDTAVLPDRPFPITIPY